MLVHNPEEFLGGFVGIKGTDKARFAEEEIEMVDAEELLFQGLKGIDG